MGFRSVNNFEELYVTADLHLSTVLNRTIKNRGFTDPDAHTIEIRNIINNTIKNKSAVLYILGDLGYRENIELLSRFIKSLTPVVKVAYGNHDSIRTLNTLWKSGIIQDFKHEFKIRWNDNLFHLHHLPLLEWEGYFENSFHCHGHTHGTIPPYYRAMDVGLDANDMCVLNLHEVVRRRCMYRNVDSNKERLIAVK